MRIVFDLDGVICELKKPSESYADVIPKNDVIEKMRDLKEDGHYLIIHTGRHMRTCDGDVSKVIEKIGKKPKLHSLLPVLFVPLMKGVK